MEPINYASAFDGIPTPAQSFTQGVQQGAGLLQLQQAQQQRQLQLARSQQMQSDLATLSRDPTPQAVAQMSLKYPEIGEQMKRSYDMLTPAQQQGELSHATQVYAAVQSGRTDVATKLLRDRATALRNSGDEQKAKAAETMADWAEMHPESFKTSAALMLSSAMGPEKFATTFSTIGDQARKSALAPAEEKKAQAEADIKAAEAAVAPQTEQQKLATNLWNNANTKSIIEDRSKRLALDKDKLRSDVELELYKLKQKSNELDGEAKKIVNDSTVAAVASDQSASQMLDFASRLEQAGASSGVAAKGAELYKSLTGNQDAITQLRHEYTRLRSTQVSKMLPPGPASDKDIQLALSGFPAETADPATMAAFVRGMAKLQQVEAANNSAKAEWVNSVGHLGKPKTDIEVDGIKVPAGSTFVDFSRQFLQRRTDERAAQQATQQVQGRSYMRFAQPAAAAPAASAPAQGQLGSGTFGIQ